MSAVRAANGATEVDAVIVGAGPNGLAAAVTLAARACPCRSSNARTASAAGARRAN